jgi:hypothetical protein
MQYDDAAFDELMKTLTDSFNVLADEVQLLSDRNLVLQHKLGFAREQVRIHFYLFPSHFLHLYDEQHSSRSGAANAAETDTNHVS